MPRHRSDVWEQGRTQAKGGLWPTQLGRGSLGAWCTLPGYDRVGLSSMTPVPGRGRALLQFTTPPVAGAQLSRCVFSAESSRPWVHLSPADNDAPADAFLTGLGPAQPLGPQKTPLGELAKEKNWANKGTENLAATKTHCATVLQALFYNGVAGGTGDSH